MRSSSFDARSSVTAPLCRRRVGKGRIRAATKFGQAGAFLCALGLAAGPADGAVAPATDLPAVQQQLAAMSVPFVPNAGQWDARAAFAARTLSGTLFVTTDGKLVYSLPAAAAPATGDRSIPRERRTRVLTEAFVSASGDALPATPRGDRPGAATVSYLTGREASRHRADLGTYERVNLGEVFDGVNVRLRATGSNVEKIFTVAPQRDPSQIRVRLEGATRIEVAEHGELIAHTGSGPVAYTAPIAFQESADGTRRDIAVRYALSADAHTYGFALGDYDRTQPLVIDPLLKAAYLGAGGVERANAVLVHPHNGFVYVVGFTTSAGSTFPGVANGHDPDYDSNTDAFVSRLSPDLTKLMASTYFGGAGIDSATAIAAHPQSGDIYVAGNTGSANLPTGFSAQPNFGGGAFDAFVARFTADLKILYRATYLGGGGDEFTGGIAVHPFTGEIYVVGETNASPTNDFPVGVGAYQTNYGGGRDAFVTRFSADLSTRTQSTFLGGTQSDSAKAIAIHALSGDVFVVGETSSGGFPGVVAGSAQPGLNGGSDAFVTRLDRTLTSVIASTYLGAGAADVAHAVAIHPLSGDVIVAGASTQSASGAAFPGMAGAPQATNAGALDAFVTRLNPSLTTAKSTYLGSGGDDEASGVAVNGSTGEIYITGYSSGAAFATPPAANEAYQPTHVSANDIFVARYREDLAERLQLTYLGTVANEFGNGIAIHPVGGSVIVAGYTGSSAFPGTTPGSPTSYGGLDDAIVAMLSPDLTAYNTIPTAVAFAPQSSVATTPASGPFPNTTRQSNEVRLVISPTPPLNVPAYVIGAPGSEICATNTAGCCRDYPNVCGGFVSGWVAPSYRFLSGDYVSVRHATPKPVGVAVTRLIVGGVATAFESSSGDAMIRCNLDADGDNRLDPLGEGLALARAMAGMTGNAVFAGTGITTPWATWRDQINANCGTNFQ
jgi:hypothetical protein